MACSLTLLVLEKCKQGYNILLAAGAHLMPELTLS